MQQLLVLAAIAAVAAAQCKSDDKRLNYLQTINSMGCTLFVWKSTRTSRLWVEPAFCVPKPQSWLPDQAKDPCVNSDPIGGFSYISVPVMLFNRTLLDDVAIQFRHLKPKSVEYIGLDSVLGVIQRWRKIELQFQPRDFIWSQSESVGMLRLSCKGIACAVLQGQIREGRWASLLEPLLAQIILKTSCYRPASSNSKLVAIQAQDADYFTLGNSPKYINFLTPCGGIVNSTVHDVSIDGRNCRLRLHRRMLGSSGAELHAEPLLCYIGGAKVLFDFNRKVHYLSANIVLRSNAALASVRDFIEPDAPTVTFMRLLDPVIKVRERVLPEPELRLSSDGDTLLMRVSCANQTVCSQLSVAVEADPLVLFSHIEWRPVSLMEQSGSGVRGAGCQFKAADVRLSVPLTKPSGGRRTPAMAGAGDAGCPADSGSCGAVRCQFVRLADGRNFLVAQQRRSASVRFDRNWKDYEEGFGDEHNFWIGLKRMQALSMPNGTQLRIEAKLWNGTQLHSEYAALRLLGPRYNLTYDRYLRHQSSVGSFDLLAGSRNAPFSTVDKLPASTWTRSGRRYFGYERRANSLKVLGNSGWWWRYNLRNWVPDFNPNGIFHYGESLPTPRPNYGGPQSFVGLNLTAERCSSGRGGGGAVARKWKSLKEVRLMLEV